ncbi:phospholipid scramblase 2-like [Pectinophora gossypiella]|uniref:phospholipid scramblase 2-like n=1 Tax=Pectinophora gossypiella TaxID=13191 RepID=UPI00214EC845|nr:phospholipid scramblase 2-like [Pectinophora gossypiella]
MATPIPMVPSIQPAYSEVDTEVKDVQPTLTPQEPAVESSPETEVLVKHTEHFSQSYHQPEPVIDKQPLAEDHLDDLATVDRLQVTRRLRVKGVLFLRGKKNQFFVRTPDQNLVYTIEEENSWWVGYFCYGLRPLQLHVLNGMGSEVIRISRPYAFTTRVLPCQLQRLQIFSPPDRLIGSVIQQWTAVKPLYMVRDITGADVFEVHGPRITISCFQDVQFQIVRPDGTLVAATNKRWEGMMHALFLAPITDKFGITFLEKSMTAEEKALLLATALLLDYMYYDV